MGLYVTIGHDRIHEFVARTPEIDEIAMGQWCYNDLFGEPMNRRSRHHKTRGILRIAVHGQERAIYRKYRAVNGLDGNDVILDMMSLRQIAAPNIDVARPIDLDVTPTGSFGRFAFYWNHPNDAARVSFKIGVFGLAVGLFFWAIEPELISRLVTGVLW